MDLRINLLTYLLVLAIPQLHAQEWTLDKDAAIVRFEMDNPIGNVEGTFAPPVDYILQFSPDNLSNAQLKASIEVASLNSGLVSRDVALMGPEFFNVNSFPKMTFDTRSIQAVDTGYIATGILSIKGFTRQVDIPFTFENQVFKASFIVERKEYEVGGESWMLGDEVRVFLSLPVK